MKNLRVFTWIGVLTFLFTISLGASGCYYLDGVKGDGNVVKEKRDVSGFTELEVSGAFEVYITQGSTEGLVVEADQNLMELIVTEVRGDKLLIYTEKGIRDAEEMSIYLDYVNLEEIDVSGAVEIKTENRMKVDNLEIGASGAAELEMSIEAETIDGDFSGASEIEFSGYADELRMDLSGASDLDAKELETKVTKLDISGAGSASVFATEELHVDASGASSVRYKGNPKVYQDTSGASSVKPY